MATSKGYGLLHRKFFDHPFWKEQRVLSRAEAWLDIVFCLARGLDDPKSGLKRGEFRASLTWLAHRWNWERSRTQRFMAELTDEKDPMLRKVHHGCAAGGIADIRIYRVCKFEVYQDPRRLTTSSTKMNNSMNIHFETPSDTPSETPNETPSLLELQPFTATSETPPETPSETLSETNIKERINTRRKKNTSASEAAPDLRHRNFVGFLLKQHPGIVIQGADHKALKDFLTETKNKPEYTLDYLQAYWIAFATSRDSFDQEQGLSVRYFCRRINRFVAKAATGPKATNGVTDEHLCKVCTSPHVWRSGEECDGRSYELACPAFVKTRKATV